MWKQADWSKKSVLNRVFQMRPITSMEHLRIAVTILVFDPIVNIYPA